MKLKGVVKGLSITLSKVFKKKFTQLYPDVMPDLPERSRGSFDFEPEKCISCNLCVAACPNGVIKIESHKGDDSKKVLDEYKMSLGYCLYCGLCVEACPTKGLTFNNKFETAVYSREDCFVCWKGKVKDKAAVKIEAEVTAIESAKAEAAAAKAESKAVNAEAAAKAEMAFGKEKMTDTKTDVKVEEEESVKV